jgi:ABC-type hemin transport system substrate-binding protein
LRLKPDLVLSVEGAGLALDRIQTLVHAPVVILPGDRLDAPARHAEALAPYLGDSGRAFARRYRQDLASVKPVAPGLSALWVIWHRPVMVAGPGTYLDDLLIHLGVRNLASNPGYAIYSDERLVTMPPAVVLYPDDLDIAPVKARVPSARFLSLPANLASRPGPRLPELLTRVARFLKTQGEPSSTRRSR